MMETVVALLVILLARWKLARRRQRRWDSGWRPYNLKR